MKGIRRLAQLYGSVKLFKAYLEISSLESGLLTPRLLTLTSELQSSGVSLIHCPHNGRKDVADKMMLGKYTLYFLYWHILMRQSPVDMLGHAIDNPAPTTILLVSGDRDFAYAMSVLRLRRYQVVLITLSNAHLSLTSQASVCHDWSFDILGVAHPSSTAGKEAKTCSRSPSVVRGLTNAINPPTSSLGSKSRNTPNNHEMSDVDIDFTDYIHDKRQNNSKQYSEDDIHRGQSTVHFISSEPSTPYFRGGVEQLPPPVMSTPTIELEAEAVRDADSNTPVVTPRTPSRILENPLHPLMNPEILTPAPPSQGTGDAKPIVPIRPDLPKFLQPAWVPSTVTAVVPVTVRPQINLLRHSPLTSAQEPSQNQGQLQRSPPSVKSVSSPSSESSWFSMVDPLTSTAPTSAEPAAREKQKNSSATRVVRTDALLVQSVSIPSKVQDSLPQPAAVPVPSMATMVVDRTATPAAVAIMTPSAVPTFATPAASTSSAAAASTIASSTTGATAASPHIPGKPATVLSVSNPFSSSPKVSASIPSAGPSTRPFAGSSTTPIAGSSTNVQPKPPVPEKFRVLVEKIRQYPNDEVTRTALGTDLVQFDKDIYKKAGVSNFAAYIDAAMVAGVVTVGRTNTSGQGVIYLRSPWPFNG